MSTVASPPVQRRATTQGNSAAASVRPTTTRRNNRGQQHPNALPCRRFYKLYPEKAGPLGNVVFTDPADLEAWLLVSHPVKPKHAEKHGGCIMYTPARTEAGAPSAEPVYYSYTASDDEVYGRASYLPRSFSTRKRGAEKRKKSLALSFDSDTSRDGCTEEDGEEGEKDGQRGVSRSSSRILSRIHSAIFA